MDVFNPKAKENIQKTGNVWGTKIEAFDKRWRFGRLCLRIEVRSKENLMGRFGGGWNFKLGLQASRFSHVLWFFGIGTFSWNWLKKEKK